MVGVGREGAEGGADYGLRNVLKDCHRLERTSCVMSQCKCEDGDEVDVKTKMLVNSLSVAADRPMTKQERLDSKRDTPIKGQNRNSGAPLFPSSFPIITSSSNNNLSLIINSNNTVAHARHVRHFPKSSLFPPTSLAPDSRTMGGRSRRVHRGRIYRRARRVLLHARHVHTVRRSILHSTLY